MSTVNLLGISDNLRRQSHRPKLIQLVADQMQALAIRARKIKG